ncbi:DUF924 family protein [Marinimicrococcus flavescens]|uniref:DUF924 domain-containing protein n=1 Tax=Marinimicrococcus flavescens TaxID=3031815 RepID=A0AAP3UY67_9PROT|nr:DUF924 domain-containing protein [Marinimicrococcus flavescens]
MINAILDFWFAPETKPRWFAADPAFDEEIRERFEEPMEAALAGGFEEWGERAAGTLALVLLLDQFPRNLRRGTASAYAGDARALEVARAALRRGQDLEIPAEQRLFLYLPFEHSEAMADQELAVSLIGRLGAPILLDYAQRHLDIVRRFGRFPHRNKALGRTTTAEEAAFLEQPGSSF